MASEVWQVGVMWYVSVLLFMLFPPLCLSENKKLFILCFFIHLLGICGSTSAVLENFALHILAFLLTANLPTLQVKSGRLVPPPQYWAVGYVLMHQLLYSSCDVFHPFAEKNEIWVSGFGLVQFGACAPDLVGRLSARWMVSLDCSYSLSKLPPGCDTFCNKCNVINPRTN